ncbi:MAG: primosomal protein N' [Flavobacteriales bacterium]
MLEEYFIDVILPLPLKSTFTYKIEKKDFNSLTIGCRIAVSFGSRKIYTGLVYRLHQNKPELYKAKPIEQIIDTAPIVTEKQIRLWEWISNYYMCSMGDVFRQALPSALKISSETFIKRNDNTNFIKEELTKNEIQIVEILDKKSTVSVEELSAILENRYLLKTIKQLLDKKLILVDEKLRQKYIPKIENYVRFNKELKNNKNAFSEAFLKLERAPKQKEIIMHLLTLELENKPTKVTKIIKRTRTSHTILNSLVKKGIIEIYQLQTDRTYIEEQEIEPVYALSQAQKRAYEEINQSFKEKNVSLLYGVTGSGKTEIYIQLIQDTLAEGKQVLFLLPEIAISTQLIYRLKQFFGNDVGYYHSKFNHQEQVELWLKTLYNQYKILIGTRSALFLPVKNVGLIIVDEEHETNFKQSQLNPRYNARDTALVWADLHKARVLLGSATPSLESYHNTKKRKYNFISLKERFGNVLMPEIQLIDLQKAYKKKEIQGYFSIILLNEIQETLEQKKQVIIFQNRRGYAPVVECQTCGHTSHCPNCDVSLTYHKLSKLLKCHYCGHTQAQPKFCPSCHGFNLDTKGLGTEQIEQELTFLFPNYKVGRMDADTTKGKYGFEKIIRAFEAKEIDILVGTQMIAKGLDFEDIGLVGILRADTLLNYPDFRAYERAFQLITQVAGRAGRKKERGKVFIQSFNPEHTILQQISIYNYEGMAKDVLYERHQFAYPPFNRIVILTLKHKDQTKLDTASDLLGKHLQKSFGEEVLGPEAPPIARIKNLYYKRILIKLNNPKKINLAKKHIEQILENFKTIKAYRSIQIIIDVDPY